MAQFNTNGPVGAPEMAEIEASGDILKDADGVETPDRMSVDSMVDSGEGAGGPTVDSDATDVNEGIAPETEASLTDDIDPALAAGRSSNYGYNGSGSLSLMTGIGASTDTGSSRFISGAGGERDPGYDKGPVVGDGSEAFPNEIHGLFGRPKPPGGGLSASA